MGSKGNVSDKAVKDKTGRDWAEWFQEIDRKKGHTMSHKEIVRVVGNIDSTVSAWWRQMITVTYEQERGLRNKHEMTDGYQISVSKTMTIPVGKLYNSWKLKRSRDRWFKEMPVEITTANKNKNLRMKWLNDGSRLDIQFNDKGNNKTQLVVQHAKINSAAQSEKLKSFWKERINDQMILLLGKPEP